MNGLPARILDLLEVDDELTVAAIALRLDANPESVERALFRLRIRGLVDSRIVELAGSLKPQYVSHRKAHVQISEYRIEWRLAS